MSSSSLRHRVKLPIDGHSYIESYCAEGTPDFVLFVHGILGDHVETWKATPAQLMTEQTLSQADFGSFGYTTKAFDSTNTRMQAEQLIPWVRTHLANYRRIFILAHSMGGLITREACALLALSKSESDRRLLSTIKHGFFIAVPIAGSPVARMLGRIPLLGRINKKLAVLAEPRVAGEHLADFYEDAISKLPTDVGRPRFSLFVGSSDALVARPPEWVMSRDDTYEGVVQGSHDTIKSDQSANSTMLRRIVQIIESYQRQVTPPHRAAQAKVATAPHGAVRDVLIVACSATKSSGPQVLHPMHGGVLESVAVDAVREAALQLRVRIKGLIETGRLEGVEFAEGNRRTRQQNRQLLLGPDFGGHMNEERYLPACRRYMGRCFQASTHEWDEFFALPPDRRPQILVMSGLYGLCSADEFIQNYDCHLSDIDATTGRTLQSHWKEALTDLLVGHLESLEARGFKVGRVVDLLAEEVYSSTIAWDRVNTRWPVLKQHFEKSHGRQALDNVGVWLNGVVLNPASLGSLRPDYFYDDPKFAAQDRVVFRTMQSTGS